MRLTRHVPAVAGSIFVLLLAGSLATRDAMAYRRYRDGCNAGSCHGAFTGSVSPKGTSLPGSKHTMHRSSSYMDTDCDLCHRTNDGDNPYIGLSDGTANNEGLGCAGCHNPAGLRLHHANNGVDFCSDCHSDGPPPGENVVPPYYGTVDTKAQDPCNPLLQANTNENWSVGDFLGIDNDGDNLYDLSDPDCAAPARSPGEASSAGWPMLLVTAHDRGSGIVALSFTPACQASDHTLEFGLLAEVANHSYAGQVCNLGNTGSASWAYPGDSLFFLVVGNNGSVEGSYGLTGQRTERPEDTGATCPLPQDLSDRCDL